MESFLGRLISPDSVGLVEMIPIAMIALLVVALWLMRRPLAAGMHERRLRRAVGALGPELLAGARVPDGMGGRVAVDYLVLTPGGLLAILVKRIPGILFAGESMDQWVQRLGGRSYRFSNPLIGLDQLVASLRSQFPDVPVRGILLFSEAVDFPKGRPARVLTLQELQSLVPGGEATVDDRWYAVWTRLQDIVD